MPSPPETFPPEHPAVVLLHRDRHQLVRNDQLADYRRTHRYVEIAILTEDGLRHANVTLELPHRHRLVAASARTRHPDGREVVHDVGHLIGQTRDDAPRLEIPDAEVGSVIAYQFVTEGPGLPQWMLRRVAWEIPLRRYELEIAGTRYIRYGITAFGTQVPFEIEDRGRDWRVRWVLEDVPPRIEEIGAPNWTHREPFWVYRLREYDHHRWVWRRHVDWNDVVRHDLAPLIRNELPQQAVDAVAAAAEDCADTMCRIQAALAWVHAQTTLAHHPTRLEVPPALDAILEAETVSPTAKTVLALAAIASLGVEAHPAAVNLHLGMRIHPNVPFAVPLHHLILFVPDQSGLDGPRWIDPACTPCRIGELPFWSAGRRALVFDPTKERVVGSGLVTTAGRPWNRGQWLYRRHYQPGADGEGLLIQEEVATGVGAHFAPLTQPQEAPVDAPPLGLREVAWTCAHDPDIRCERRLVSHRRIGTVHHDHMVVDAWARRPGRLAPERRLARDRGFTAEAIDEVRVTPPAGWRIGSHPGPRRETIDGVEIVREVELQGNDLVIRTRVTLPAGVHSPETASAHARASSYSEAMAGARIILRPDAGTLPRQASRGVPDATTPALACLED
jgi:hypothetical protein